LANQRVALALEAWCSLSKRQYISVKAHWIDEQWRMHRVLLGNIRWQSTEGTIGQQVLECVREFVTPLNVMAVVTDGSSDMSSVVTSIDETFAREGLRNPFFTAIRYADQE